MAAIKNIKYLVHLGIVHNNHNPKSTISSISGIKKKYVRTKPKQTKNTKIRTENQITPEINSSNNITEIRKTTSADDQINKIMKKHIMTTTKTNTISLSKLRLPKLQYKNNKNRNIEQKDKNSTNNNDTSPPKNTNRQHCIQSKNYGTLNNPQIKSKHKNTTTSVHQIFYKTNASTSRTLTTNKNSNEITQNQRQKKIIIQYNNIKLIPTQIQPPKSIYRITANQKKSSPKPVPTTTAPLRGKL